MRGFIMMLVLYTMDYCFYCTLIKDLISRVFGK